MPFNDPLQEHTESSVTQPSSSVTQPSGVPSSVKASRSGSPALVCAKMQEMYEEHKRWIIAGELERLVTAQVFSFFPFFSFHPTLVRCVRVRNRNLLSMCAFVHRNLHLVSFSHTLFRSPCLFPLSLWCSAFLCTHSHILPDSHLNPPAAAIGPEDTR